VSFQYLRDPLFLVCFILYWVNRFLEDYDLSTPFLRSYLNDLLCVPFWIPIMLWVNRRLGLRRHDAPPLSYEIVIPLLIWVVVFEVILPSTHIWRGVAVADPNDVLCYSLGGLIAARIWEWRYADQPEQKASD